MEAEMLQIREVAESDAERIAVEHTASGKKWTFELSDSVVQFCGSQNTDHWTYSAVPDAVLDAVLDYFGAPVGSDSDDLADRRPSDCYEIVNESDESGVLTFSVQLRGSIIQYLFKCDDDLKYQGPLNSGAMSWEEVPSGAQKLAEDHADSELVGDTEEWMRIKNDSRADKQ